MNVAVPANITTASEVAATLPALIDRAVSALAKARTAAEVLEARDIASFAYDVAKKAARLGKAKQAHDSLVAAAHRSQADALVIEAEAKRKLADEYDAAQERGEINSHGGDRKTIKFENSKLESVKPDELHEARAIRDAEQAEPGLVQRTVDEAIEIGEEPTRAKVRRAVKEAAKPRKPAGHRHTVEETQHDRDLRMLRGVWEAACETARAEFLATINGGYHG